MQKVWPSVRALDRGSTNHGKPMSIQQPNALSDCGTEVPNTSSSALSTCEIHTILSNQRRLYLLEELFAREGVAEFNDLVDAVVVRELEIAPDDPDWSTKRKTVRVSLYQTHIKRLKESSIVDYTSKTGTISLGEHADAVAPYLEVPGIEETHGFFDRVSRAFGL